MKLYVCILFIFEINIFLFCYRNDTRLGSLPYPRPNFTACELAADIKDS